MPQTTATPQAAPTTMQGIAIPAAVINPTEFFRRTRRHTQQEKVVPFTINSAGGGSTQDVVSLRKSDILSEITLHITGTLTVTPGSGTVASLAAWPYNIIKNLKFTANGASQLISASGWTLRAREIAKDEGLNDRGVTQTVAGVTRNQGTLSLGCESWGVGSNTSALTANTYAVDLVLVIPVAEDPFDLTGAIFLQSATADLSIEINWAQPSDLFALTGNGAVSMTGQVQVLTTKQSIPTADGAIIVPDLSLFHSLVESTEVALQNGENEPRVVGQGAGKNVLRIIYRLLNGNPSVPVPMTAANFGLQAWRYATSETPDQFIDGSAMRIAMERAYCSDLGGLFGFGVHEFAKAGFRDLVDMGTTAELRLVTNILSSVTLTQPKLQYTVESLYSAGSAG
jgi:hypothetical protein